MAECTNNKDIFLTILRWHVRAAHLQYLRTLQVDLEDADGGDEDDEQDLKDLLIDKEDGISCTLGIRYPTLQAILSGKNHQTLQVKSS